MAIEEILIQHQPYLKFKKTEEEDGGVKVVFDTDKKISELIDNIVASELDGQPTLYDG